MLAVLGDQELDNAKEKLDELKPKVEGQTRIEMKSSKALKDSWDKLKEVSVDDEGDVVYMTDLSPTPICLWVV